MLCITGSERTIDDLVARVTASDAACRVAEIEEPLVEVRLDMLDDHDDSTFEALARLSGRAVVACRPTRQGGSFSGPESDRLAILRRAAATGARLVDVEYDVPADALIAIRSSMRRQESTGLRGVLVSCHDFQGVPQDLPARVRAMNELGGDALKVAIRVDDAAEVSDVVDACTHASVPCIAIGMGFAGVVSRTHYAALGSPLSYVAGAGSVPTAPGQLSLDEALALGMPRSASQPLCALVGGEQIRSSPGPRVYNRLFRALGRGEAYVPVETRRLEPTLRLLEQIGVRGVSVTMPLKREALAVAQADELARTVGAANSLRVRRGWEATNTDVVGVSTPLSRAISKHSLRRALILGSGGAARAASVACRSLGLEVTVCARDEASAREVATDASNAIAWGARSTLAPLHDAVLINATPLSGRASPWPEEAPLDASVVFDLAVGGRDSTLLDRARSNGAVTISPLEMWLAQGAAQLSWFLDDSFEIDQLRELL